MKHASVLVVEDERIIGSDIQACLERLGYPVSALVGSGEEALAIIELLPPDLVLMDIRLGGGLDGIETAERICRQAGIPVVYLTAHADPETVRRAARTEAYGYLVKPFSELELHSTIQLALYKSETERERAERQAWFRKLVENASDMVRVLDAGGIVLYEGPSVLRVLGHPPSTLQGTSIFHIVHPDDHREVRRFLHDCASRPGVPIGAQFRMWHLGGEWRVVEGRGTSRIDDPSIGGIVVNCRDITERVRAQEELQAAGRVNARFATAVENLSTGVLITDPHQPDNPVIYANPGFLAITGYIAEEILGRNARFLQGKDTDPGLVQEIRQAIAEQRPFKGRIVNYRKDGTPFWNEMTISPIFGPESELINFVGLQSDITEEVRAEELIQGQLREKTVLLQEVHHRVKNNLQIISSLLNMQIRGLEDPQAIAALQETRSRIHAIALTHETLYRSDNFAEIDLADYIRSLAEQLQRMHLGGHSIALRLDLQSCVVTVAQAVPCGLMVSELVSNAIKHAFNSDDTELRREICIALEIDDPYCTLAVSDSGTGLPAGLDVHGSRSVGMQLITSLTQQLKGTVEVRREPRTEFRITFQPAVPEA